MGKKKHPPFTEIYTVKAGDTFYKIANEFGITVSELQMANPLVNPFNLLVGQKICIPKPPATPPCDNGIHYIIKSGDTFYSIANRFGITLSSLEAANPHIDPNNLVIGSTICVPKKVVPPETSPCPNGTYYTIKAGDTYFKIANRFRIAIDDLERANPNIDPANLIIGQKICIPKYDPQKT